jgi:hypothetical protein
VLGFGRASGGDEVFKDPVLARIIEPVRKLDSLRVLEEAGAGPASYATLKRQLPAYAKDAWRRKLAAACAAHAQLGRASLVLYDVSTLYFETDAGDGFRESGFSKERRLEPQITIGLLTDQAGFPLMVSAFEGNRAETKTMLPVIKEFMVAHQLPDVTVVADAGMISEANQKDIEAAGLSFILGMRIPHVPYTVAQWRREHRPRRLRRRRPGRRRTRPGPRRRPRHETPDRRGHPRPAASREDHPRTDPRPARRPCRHSRTAPTIRPAAQTRTARPGRAIRGSAVAEQHHTSV